jgi:hypothetical protein
MTPKEKAKDLVDKMNYSHPEFEMYIAKQCALTAVDEILSVIDRDMNYQNSYSFYLDVKQEIQNL